MQIEYRSGSYSDVVCDVLAFPVFEGENAESSALRSLNKAARGVLSLALTTGEFKPELYRVCVIHRPAALKASRLLLIGAGKRNIFGPAALRKLAGAVARKSLALGARSVALMCRGDHRLPDLACVVADGAIHGTYDHEIYKTRDREQRKVDRFIILGGDRVPRVQVENAIAQGKIIAQATNFSRTLVNEPANVLTPSVFAERAVEFGKRAGIQVEILEREEMEKLGMHTLLAVTRGSEEPPKMILLRHGSQSAKPGTPLHAFIGKGVTFDSGGISLKPADRMEEMKGDMAGGAAVLAAVAALAQLKTRHRIIGLIPAVENMPSGRAARPGDVVKSASGKTVEIINTDAEGRLILADTLAYARQLGATRMIDIATLTGACMIALGLVRAGVFGTDQKTIERLLKGGSFTGEKLWQLPLDDEYRELIRSDIADVKNVGNRWGGAITAAKFLQEFVEDTPWVHLDIAGLELDNNGTEYQGKGATGFGVRTLIHSLWG